LASDFGDDAKAAPEITSILDLDKSTGPEGLDIGRLAGSQTVQDPFWQIGLVLIPEYLPYLRVFQQILMKSFGITSGHHQPGAGIVPRHFVDEVTHIPVSTAG
jgi:hypothetical protein